MLSTENPPPSTDDSDPPTCSTPLPCEEISHLIKSGGDERASSDDKVPLQEEVDLFKSGLDYDNNPLPKFSIRDYVFSTRSKDINTNWPFSQKNLQLCLKHGVKDLLPPFQPLESLRNRSIERCTVETSLINNQNITDLDGKPSISPSMASDHQASDNPGSCTQNLAFDCVDIGLEESKGEKKRDSEVQVTTTSQSLCEIDPADKSKSKNQSPVKKCRLIVKVGSGAADPSSNEDHMSKSVAVSETMASNVCPVCKNFSSSSNTTLNAHIDQCLSPESNMTWTPNSRVVKHRIKPRKMRLMTDIYVTARHCTLEELDRRNGTNWALNTSFPAQENVEDCVEEEEERVASVDLKEKGDEGAVYIDANGTKVRILSKFNDASSSVPKREADIGTRKILKGGKGSKLDSSSKKRHHAQKHQKYLELALQSKQFCSSKPRRTTEVHGDGEINFSLVENCGKVGSLPQPLKAQEQIKPNGSGTMMKWACSKRTVLFKKRNLKEGLHDVACNFRQEHPAESDQPSLGDSYAGRSCVKKSPNMYESPLSSPENRKRLRNSSFKMPFSECNDEPCTAKKVGFTSFGSQTERFLESPQRSVKQFRIDSASANASSKGFANNGEQYVPYLGKQPVEINANLRSNPSRNHHVLSSKAPKFSSLKKHVLSAGQSVVTKSKCKVKMKFTSNKKSGMRCAAESTEEIMPLPSMVEKHDSKKKHSENPTHIPGNASLGRRGVLKLRKKRGAFGISHNEDSRPLNSAAECHSHEVGKNIDSSARVCGDITDTFGDRVISPSLGVDLGDNAMSLSRSLSPEFHKLGSPSLGDEQEMFCVDKAVNNLIAENTDMGEGGMDSKDGQGNYFSEVDPIPIPGPPGSFLPSPRDMGSEDLQGNSSITTSRVHSSEDHHDLVDRDSSDSPISATSTVSNSMMARSDSKSSESMFTKDEIHLGISVASSYDAVAQNNTAPVSQAATMLSERANLNDKGFTGFRNDQPCCCSRKEGISQGVSLNYQESQLLRRRTMASVPTGKQPSYDSNRRSPNSSNSLPEMIPMDNFPGMKSAVGSVSVKVSTDSALNSPAFGDCDSASPSPSASNSMIRLMGRNLMVVNKDENVSQQFKPVVPQSVSPHHHPNQHFEKLSGFSSGNTQSEDFSSFYHMVHQHPNMGFPQASSSPLASSGVLFSKNVGGYHFPNDPYRSWKRNADSTAKSMKEIIVIDETLPARKADSAADIAPFPENMMENRVSSAGIPILMAANYNSRYMNPFYSYQPPDYTPNSESKSHMTQSASFQIPPHSRASTSSSNLRSSTYYSPSFS